MPIPLQLSNRRLRYDAQRASVLNLSARGIDFLFQLVSMAILARLLTPADFGVFAMATPFVWILMTFGDLGLASAVLQQRDLSEGQASAVFLINLVAGIAFGGLFLLSAPMLGSFYGDPEVTHVASALSLMFVFSGFTAVQQALLRRALMFNTLLRAQIAASLASSVLAVIFALKGAGYWALTIRALADPLVYSIVVWTSTGWMPTRAEWDDTTKALLRYGRYVVGSSLLFSIGRHANNVFIGWRFGSAELGPFALANRLLLLPAQQISWPLGQVMIPILSRLQGEPDRLKRWYLKLLRLVTFASFPPLFSLAICADDVVHVIAGPQWGPTADILALFAPVAALQVGYASTDWLMRAQGQGHRFFCWTVIDTTAVLLGCVLGLRWGAIGVAAGLATANVVLFLPSFAYAAQGTTIRLVDALEAMLPCFLLMTITLAAVWALRHFIAQDWTPFPRLLLTGVTIVGIMACGTVWVYGRSVLNLRLLTSQIGTWS
jgi:PST family polysaccharide transporter